MANEGSDIRGPIFITKQFGRTCDPCSCIPGFFPCDGEPRTTEIRNLQCVTIDLNSPLERYPIPETHCSQAINIKVLGNSATITITWTVVEETTNIVRQTLDACGAETCNAKGGIDGGCTKFVENQIRWWTGPFQANSIQDRYNLYLGDCFACACANRIPTPTPLNAEQENANFAASNAFHREGSLHNVRFQKSGTTPVTWTGTITFYGGDIQTEPNECAP